jgi:hypothetical protein
MKLGRSATAPVLAIAMIGISARPVWIKYTAVRGRGRAEKQTTNGIPESAIA